MSRVADTCAGAGSSDRQVACPCIRRPGAHVQAFWTYVLVVPAEPAPIAVVLADVHPAALAGLRAALADRRFRIVAEVADADAAVAAAAQHGPDVCLVDAALPGGAVAATARIVRDAPSTAVVVLAERRDDASMFEAVRAGAAGYLLKDMDPERLRFAIRGVTEGEAALPRKLVTRLMEEFRGRDRRQRITGADGAAVALTAREWDVLELLRGGASTRAIAEALAISTTTVRRHLSTAMAKLGASDRASAIAALERSRGR